MSVYIILPFLIYKPCIVTSKGTTYGHPFLQYTDAKGQLILNFNGRTGWRQKRFHMEGELGAP